MIFALGVNYYIIFHFLLFYKYLKKRIFFFFYFKPLNIFQIKSGFSKNLYSIIQYIRKNAID